MTVLDLPAADMWTLAAIVFGLGVAHGVGAAVVVSAAWQRHRRRPARRALVSAGHGGAR